MKTVAILVRELRSSQSPTTAAAYCQTCWSPCQRPFPCLSWTTGPTTQISSRRLRAARESGLSETSSTSALAGPVIWERTARRTEFVFFVNPDVTLHSNTIEELVIAADRYPTASAFNPAMESRRGKELFRRSSVVVPRKEWMRKGWPDGDTEVMVLSGAALLVRKSCFDLVGGFDRNIYLYHEDDDLSLRLRERCGPVMFIRAARVRHLGSRSSPSTTEVVVLKAWHMGQSRVYATRKHHVPWAFAKALGSASLQVVFSLAVFSPRKRSKQIAFLKGVLGLSLEDATFWYDRPHDK